MKVAKLITNYHLILILIWFWERKAIQHTHKKVLKSLLFKRRTY
jgi:hypothetical protein